MMITIAEPAEWSADLHYALAGGGQEHCAVLIGTHEGDSYTVHAVYGVDNLHRDVINHWRIGPAQYAEAAAWAETRGWSVIGTAHTHINARSAPSPQDLRVCRPHHIGLVWDLFGGVATWYTHGSILRVDHVAVNRPESSTLPPSSPARGRERPDADSTTGTT